MKKKNFLAKGRSLLLFLAFSSITFFSAQTGPTDDWDGDGIVNQTDLDDDNDGISDINEGLCTAPLISAGWTISGTTASYNFGNGVIARVSKVLGTGNFTSETLNTTNFWTPSVAGSPALGSLYTWESRIIIRFETASGAPVLIDKPVIHVDRLGGNFSGTFGPTGTARAVSALISLANGLTWTELSGTNDFNTTTTTAKDNGAGNTVATNFLAESNTGPDNTHAAGGSLQINQTVSEITLDFPRATTNVGNAGGDGLDIVLSNICPVVDTDGDGIADHFDLDSDGDGCSDAVEGGGGFTNSALIASSINGGNTGTTYNGYAGPINSNLGNTVDTNGIPTIANGGQNVGSSKIISPDTDGDGVGNTCDLIDNRPDIDGDGIKDDDDIDDDNDGALDATESPACFYTATEAEVISTVKTFLTNDDGSNVDLPFMHDGVATSVAASNNIISINQAINGAVIYTIEYPTSIKLTSITHNGTTFGTGATAMIQGSNDSFVWFDLMTAATAATAAAKTFIINNNTANSYRYYRIVKVAGTTTPAITTYEVSGVQNAAEYIPSSHPKPTCNTDTDTDGIVNHHDLDSDGDGCSDSVEAGNTPFTSNNTTTINTGTDANNNGLLDQFENGTTGTINYVSTYDQYAVFANISACTDTDGDGIADIIDIDDDNDGVLDVNESTFNPYLNTTCENNLIERMGYTSTFTLNNQAADKIGLIVGTDNTFTTGFPMGAACATISFGNSSATFNSYIYFKFVNPYNTAEQVPLNYMTLTSDCSGFNEIVQYDAYDINGNFLYNQSLTTTPAYGANYCVTIQPPAGVQVYSIRVQQVLSAAILSGISLKGISNYNDLDTDGDGIPNRLDLDSDGDGCPDAVEAGTATQAGAGNTSPGTLVNTGGSQTGVANAIVGDNTPAAYGANGFYSGVETNDSSSAAYTGQYTYNQYAIVSALNACTDTDGDGTPDLFDIDDDNDGIVDATESPACFYTAAEANVISKITSQFTSPDDNQTDGDIQLLHDGAAALTFNFNAFATTDNPTGSNLLTIEYSTSLQLATLSVSDNITTTANANAVVVGSNDGITWSTALSPATLITATPTVFTITATQPYKYYRIQTGSTPGALAIANTIGEISSTVATSYIPSAHQKPVICSVDTDGDTIPNHLDLDSDGDGCSDLAESGVSPVTDVITPSTTNNAGGSYGIVSPNGSQLNPTAADTNNDGLNDSVDSDLNNITNYTSTYSNAINSAITACTLFCYRPAVTAGTVLDTQKGITSLGRAGVSNSNWPMVRKGGWIALEAKTKGFVPNRLSTAEINAIPAANLVEGMMVYNITLDCLQINTDGTAAGWKCFNTQACP